MENLTKREQQVADLIAEGLTCRQMGNRLGISMRTAEIHTANVGRKLGVKTRIQQVKEFLRVA